jgi:hypothetical protein
LIPLGVRGLGRNPLTPAASYDLSNDRGRVKCSGGSIRRESTAFRLGHEAGRCAWGKYPKKSSEVRGELFNLWNYSTLQETTTDHPTCAYVPGNTQARAQFCPRGGHCGWLVAYSEFYEMPGHVAGHETGRVASPRWWAKPWDGLLRQLDPARRITWRRSFEEDERRWNRPGFRAIRGLRCAV